MPAIRSTGIQTGTTSSYAVFWPAGTVAGDLVIIFCAGGFFPNTPSGWTAIAGSSLSGSNWQGCAFYKILTSTDITTGSVTVSWGGSFNSVVAIASLAGPAPAPLAVAQRNSTGSASIALTSSTDRSLVFYFGSNRAASTDTVNRGTLLQTANDGSAASGCLYAETTPAASVTATFSYSAAGTGNYQAIVGCAFATDYAATTAPHVGDSPVLPNVPNQLAWSPNYTVKNATMPVAFASSTPAPPTTSDNYGYTA